MSPRHHPRPESLDAHAAGRLTLAQHLVVTAHLWQCSACRSITSAREDAAGAALEDLPPAGLAPDAFARVAARLEAEAQPPPVLEEVQLLPRYLRGLRAAPWTPITARLEARRVDLGDGALDRDGSRLLLLRAQPGTTLRRHTHTGREMTCVLTGRFSHDGGTFAAGDFDCGDATVMHEIRIGEESPCISLVALDGKLVFPGALGKILQWAVRL